MKKSSKITLAAGFLILTAAVTSSCTSNFCKNIEKSRILFAVDPGVSEYFDSETKAKSSLKEGYTYKVEQVYESNSHLWRRIEIDKNGKYTKSNQMSSIIETCSKKYYVCPTIDYLKAMDLKILNLGLAAYNAALPEGSKVSESNLTVETTNTILKEYGYLKFYGEDDKLWANYDKLNGEIAYEIGSEKCPSVDFVKTYKSTMESAVSGTKSCIAITEGEYGAYGQYPHTTVKMDPKDWGYAWSKGPISGLIVYPVAWLVDAITTGIAGGNSQDVLASGWPQLLALVIVTIIVRLFIFLVTFKSTLSQQKMQALQPELAKIQAKYPNSNTNKNEKQRLAEEQMRLYKKNKINPMGQLLILVVQFPIFIGVWGAMTGSAVLSTGSFLNLNLSTSILDALKNTNGLPSNDYGWWTALILFILMAVAQFLSMKIPQWIQKRKNKKIARLGVNPAQKSQNRTMNIVSYVMLVMIIVMGFTLPAAMGVYWFVGAVFSLAQSFITQAIVGKKKHNK